MPWRRRQIGLMHTERKIPKAFLEFYADDTVLECGCGGMKAITGKDSLNWMIFNRKVAARPSRIPR
jgi:hypothetical protein